MRSVRALVLIAAALAIAGSNLGCMSRIIDESVGAVTGASGIVVGLGQLGPDSLAKYRGARVDSLTMSPGLKAPPGLLTYVREQFTKAAAAKGLTPTGQPSLVISGEVLNYESAGAVDTLIGPLEEVIVRTKLTDAQTNQVLGVANLIGRGKSTTSGGEKRLSEGLGKALKKWLKEGGIKKDVEEEKK